MSAPTIVTIRPGVAFEPGAAASWRRMEKAAGRLIDVNSSYRSYAEQLNAYNAYQAYVNGTGPWAPYALHPDKSMHCKGLAADSDDQSLLRSLSDHGWRQTALAIHEPWHFDYFPRFDQHQGEPAGGGDVPFPIPEPEPDDPATEEDDVRSMKGCQYVRASDKATVNLLFNESSGFWSEFTGGGGTYNDDLAVQWETGSWPTITESHAGAMKRSLDKVRLRSA